jgi:hypothetical protein
LVGLVSEGSSLTFWRWNGDENSRCERWDENVGKRYSAK